jgi:hypothetical protein
LGRERLGGVWRRGWGVRSLRLGGEAGRWGLDRCSTRARRGRAAAVPLCHARRRQGRHTVGPGGSERKPVARGPAWGKEKRRVSPKE